MPFHVFLSHSSADKPAVEALARWLAKEGIQAWLDKWHLIPGEPWQPALEKALADAEACAVFIGPSGFGPWQNEDMRAAIERRVRGSGSRFRVIPVLLPGAERAERSSLPAFLAAATWVEFRDSLEDEEAFHRLVCGIRGREPGPGPGQALYEGQCPYRGLRAFDVEDAPFFFGREALVQWLLNELRPAATEGQAVNRFLAIVGASGSGKSSLARAGLVAAVKREGLPGSSGWPVAILRPGPEPLEELALALSAVATLGPSVGDLFGLIRDLQSHERTLHLRVRQALAGRTPGSRFVVLVDQFEEIFTRCSREEFREAFVRNLLYAAKAPQGQTLVILAMRADFYAKCAANAELAAALSDHHLLMGPMTEEELRRAIERPALLAGGELEAGLVDLLVQDVRQQPGALPLLQHALLELWHKREDRRLTVKAYQEIGKLEGALRRRADATLQAFSAEEQELCRRTFLRLTQPGEGTEDTKRRASMQELLSLSESPGAAEALIQKLADAALLTTHGDLRRQDAFVEVAHEALIRNWPQLRRWIDADRSGLRTRTRLTEAAREWNRAGRDPAYLYSGARLALAEEWATSHPGELSTDEVEFLRGSREAQQLREASELEAAQRLARAETERAVEAEARAQEQKRAAAKLRRRAVAATSAAGAALLLLAIAAVLWRESESAGADAARQAQIATAQRTAAQDQARIANDERLAAQSARAVAEEQARIAECRRLATESSFTLTQYPQRSLLLAVEAARLGQSFPATRVASAEQSLREALGFLGGRGLGVAARPTPGHKRWTSAVAFSPDDRWLVTGGKDKTARLWDLKAQDPRANPLLLPGHEGAVDRVAFRPDGRWLVTSSGDDTAWRWDLKAQDPGANPLPLRGYGGEIDAIKFSPDGRWLVARNIGTMPRLWDLRAQDPGVSPLVLQGHDDDVTEARFSSDGRWLVTGSKDKTARLWDLKAQDPSVSALVLRGHEALIGGAGFSHDGHWLLTGSIDGMTQLWAVTAQGPAASVVVRGHINDVFYAAFSPDDRWLVTSGKAKAARLWDLKAQDPGTNPLVLRGHEGQVTGMDFSPDGRWLVTGSEDRTARLWDLKAPDPGASPVMVLHGHEGAVDGVEFSPDGRWLVTSGMDDTARLWDWRIQNPAANPLVLQGHGKGVNAVAVSPDGHRLATGDEDGTARLWDLTARGPAASPMAVLRGHEGAVVAVAFSPDGRWLATGGRDAMARLWDLRSQDPGADPLLLWGHLGAVVAVAFSPDGHWLATGGSIDHSARLWDLKAQDPRDNPLVLRNRENGIQALAIRPDGHWLVTGSYWGGTVQLWDLRAQDPGGNPLALQGHRGSVLAVAFSPDNRWLATGGWDSRPRLWDLVAQDPGANPLVLRGHESAVVAVTFSPDNRWLATGSEDGTARLWDLRSQDPGASPVILRGHESKILGVGFSSDNCWLVTGSEDGTARLWLLNVDDLIDLARVTVGRNLSSNEWQRYFPGKPYRKTFAELSVPGDEASE